ncbi:MAG: 2-C-methyl-D-erythritol 2,4-cyclodiphosphate synthase [Clostridia bacterium]|nr:2-C-methyl-D-erythritol 2,4-cyclodiphosphate synthase [Clostridia bacterium]
MPVTDTVVIAKRESVDNVPERNSLYSVQTPQGFYTKDIKRAYNMAKLNGFEGTDDSSVYSKFIKPAHLYLGEIENKKLTYKQDFNATTPPTFIADEKIKIGYGVDVHAFGGEENFITLCGVQIANDKGLVAHSDGDIAVHAIMDAILSALALKDIGHYFPDTDEKYKDANSIKMLEKVVEIALDKGYSVGNLSLTIQAERPKLAPNIDKMIENLAISLQTDKQNIGVAAGTCEKLGFVGEGLGICATCAVILKRNTK